MRIVIVGGMGAAGLLLVAMLGSASVPATPSVATKMPPIPTPEQTFRQLRLHRKQEAWPRVHEREKYRNPILRGKHRIR